MPFGGATAQNAYVYFHGGPGFNSRAEEHFLGPYFRARAREIFFWNEPSSSERDWANFEDRAFTRLSSSVLEALENQAEKSGPVRAIGHSFASHALLRIAAKRPELFSGLFLICPTIDLFDLCKNILRLASGDFYSLNQPSHGDSLSRAASEAKALLDPAMKAGLALAAKDPLLLGHYFANRETRRQFDKIWQMQGLQIDAPSFFAVMGELAGMETFMDGLAEVRIPMKVFWTAQDPVVIRSVQEPFVEKIAPHATAHLFEESAHFPHLEQTELFFKALES